MFERRKKRWEFFVSFSLIVFVCLFRSSRAVRPLREVPSSLDNENPYTRKNEDDFSDYSEWNLTGTYKGTWRFLEQMNNSSSSLDLAKPNGVSILELVSTPSKIHGLHYVKGAIIFHDVFGSEHDLGVTQLRMSGVFIWPFQTLRMIANSGIDGDPGEEDYLLKSPYHLLGVYSSQVLQDSPRDKIQRLKNSLTRDREKQCIFELNVAVSQVSSTKNDGDKEHYHLEGLLESPSMDYDGECFSPIALNVTSLNIEVYYSKAVNYTLMVTFISFLQVLLLIRQMEHTNTQSGAAKVSILMIGQQAIMDAYLCLLHLTAGILIESLFNAFATAAFFKFVVFSIFEMRYLLAIWKASRPTSSGEGWETMRRELSVLYSRFYGILLGGILIMYQFHNFLRPILFIMYSFWIPQIVTNVTRDTRKPLHPHYIIGMTLTRLAIPMYMFGCPNNFMHIEPDISWSIYLGIYMGLQALVLLLQHYLGSRWFIPHQILPEKYSYYRRIENDRVCGTDCVICMTSIDLTSRSSDYMVTPCDHLFHSGCLQRWMDIKMECPTCRRSLPPA